MIRCDQLLYVISAKQELSWAEFKSVADTLLFGGRSHTEDWPFVRHRILRILDSLGHCDFIFGEDGGTVYAAPPALVRLPRAGKITAILTGSRAPQTLDDLVRRAVKHPNIVVEKENQRGSLAASIPVRICLTGSTENDLATFADQGDLAFDETPATWKLVHFGANLDSYLGSLTWTEGPELNWRRIDFDPEYCRFQSGSDIVGSLRLSRYSDPIRNIFRYRLWKKDSWASVDLDWGRYAVLRDHAFDVLFYDSKLHIMLVPFAAPLPRVFERALGLCSGLAPLSISSGRKSSTARTYHAFQAIPLSIAELTCARVGQALSQCDLSASFSSVL